MINLVTVVGRNTHILPHMLKHYESMVDKMYVVVYRQSEDDNILQEVEDLGITPHLVETYRKFDWNHVTYLYNKVKLEKPNEWWIVSDDDELQVYPKPLEEIIAQAEKQRRSFVTGGFLDRIGPDGTFPVVTRDTDLHKAFPYAGFFRYPMSGACPNKVTLMRGYQQICPGQHYAVFPDGSTSWGVGHRNRLPVDDCFAQVHHFKWDSTVLERLKEVSEVHQPYSYHKEYNKMYRSIARTDWKIDIKNPAYKVEKLKEFSYINYMDYPHWEELKNLIITI